MANVHMMMRIMMTVMRMMLMMVEMITMDLKVNMMKPVFHTVNCTKKRSFYRHMRDT
jgi:hypothetical protein